MVNLFYLLLLNKCRIIVIMSGRKSKNKGKSYERDIANFLSDLYKESFTRVPYSGAFVGGQNISRIQNLSESQTRGFKGDIIPPDDFRLLVIEAKNYGEFKWNQFALGEQVKQLNEWIKQSQDSCEPQDKWLLCVKISRQGEFVMWDPAQWNNLKYHKGYLGIIGHSYKTYHYINAKEFWESNKDAVKEQSNDR